MLHPTRCLWCWQGPRPEVAGLAGRVADGVVLAEPAGASYVSWVRAQTGRDPLTSVFMATSIDDDRRVARRHLAPFLIEMLAEPNVALRGT